MLSSVKNTARLYIQVHTASAIGLVHHPLRNLIATFADEAEFKMWKA